MGKEERLINFEKARPLGIGRLTACVHSTQKRKGLLIGSTKGLYHMSHPKSKVRRIRSWPVGYLLSGEDGVVCYEEAGGHGRIAVLDADLEERMVDDGLAREINPKAYACRGLLILHRDGIEHMDVSTLERRRLAEYEPCITVGPFASVKGGYEFLAVHRGAHWPTWLYRLDIRGERCEEAVLSRIAQAEDPIFPRVFLPLPTGDYFIVPQGQSVFQTYRLFPGARPELKTWSLVAIPGDAHPVGIVLMDGKLCAAGADCLLIFRPGDELLRGS